MSERDELPTICFRCAHSYGTVENQCSWAREFEPVQGWNAIYTPPRLGLLTGSYIVLMCPEYEHDGKRNPEATPEYIDGKLYLPRSMIAVAIGMSPSSIDRFLKQGMPHRRINKDKYMGYNPEECLEWRVKNAQTRYNVCRRRKSTKSTVNTKS